MVRRGWPTGVTNADPSRRWCPSLFLLPSVARVRAWRVFPVQCVMFFFLWLSYLFLFHLFFSVCAGRGTRAHVRAALLAGWGCRVAGGGGGVTLWVESGCGGFVLLGGAGGRPCGGGAGLSPCRRGRRCRAAGGDMRGRVALPATVVRSAAPPAEVVLGVGSVGGWRRAPGGGVGRWWPHAASGCQWWWCAAPRCRWWWCTGPRFRWWWCAALVAWEARATRPAVARGRGVAGGTAAQWPSTPV